ncbi:MAG: hypothetical protein R6W77_05390 [Trueperaceae bacterium]
MSAAALAGLTPHAQLDRFRPPPQQLKALVDIAADPRGCVTGSVLANRAPNDADQDGTDDLLVGYAAFHPPSDVESWGDDRSGRLVELGAIEVAPDLRGQRLAERMLETSFAGGRFDDTVVFATLYVWHYDLARTGLGDLAYRRMLERLYRSAGLVPYPTGDVEVRSSAANALMARVGPDAPEDVVAEFHRLRKRGSFSPVASGPSPTGGGW